MLSLLLLPLVSPALVLSQSSIPTSGYPLPTYPALSTPPFNPQNLTAFTQPTSPNNFTSDGPPLQLVHEIYTTFPTGVAVALDDRIFINFPRSAAENTVTLGVATSFNTSVAYPNASIQTCAPGQNVSTCFINVQSVVIDSAQRIWALDTGIGPGGKEAVKYGAKIMAFSLKTNAMLANYVLPWDLIKGGTNINDVRFNLSLSTAGIAFLSDEQGSLITIDLATHTYRRRLKGTPMVLADNKFVGSYDGTPFYMWNGTTRSHLTIGSDGIALQNGNLYFGPLAARRLYQVPQAVLANASATEAEIAAAVQFVGQTGSYLSGFSADNQGRVYMGAAEQNAVMYFNTSIASLTSLTSLNGLTAKSANASNKGVIPAADIEVAPFVRSALVQWPDSMCVQNGFFWFTTNQLPLMPSYQRDNIDRRSLPYKIYRASIGKAGPAV